MPFLCSNYKGLLGQHSKIIRKNLMTGIINCIPHNAICSCIHNHATDNVYTNNCLCYNAFENFSTHDEYMEYDEFVNWLKINHVIINFIKNSCSYHIQSNIKRKESVSKTDIIPQCLSNNRFESSLTKRSKRFNLSITRHYMLYGEYLYYYTNRRNLKPKGVIFLLNAKIERINPNTISINGKQLYNEDQEIIQIWYDKLKSIKGILPFEEFYEREKYIADGGFSKVYECSRKLDNKKFCVKIIDKNNFTPKDQLTIKNELAILQLVNHPNIIHMEQFFENENKIHIIWDITTIVTPRMRHLNAK